MSDQRFIPSIRERYLSGGLRSVEGWLDPFAARGIDRLARYQHERAAPGSVGEIGVHHGKLFLALYLTTQSGEKACAIDIFANQDLNPDCSGKGDRARFLANIDRHAGTRDGLVIIGKSSFSVSPQEVTDACGQMRFFSIDGGHTEDCTLHDLRLAEAVMAPHGIVVLDDYFCPTWPAVSAGAACYLLARPALLPFAVLSTKLLLARPEWHAAYTGVLERALPIQVDKTAVMFGSRVVVLASRHHGWKRALAYSRYAPAMRRIKRLFA